MTKLALADFAGIQESYVRSIAKGRKNPSIGVLYALAEALQVEPLEFMGRIEQMRLGLLEKASK